jgi:hypothetical protein
MPIPHERNTIGDKHPNALFEDGPGPGLESVGGEFQPSFATVYPGGDAYLLFALRKKGTPRFDARVPFRIRKTLV